MASTRYSQPFLYVLLLCSFSAAAAAEEDAPETMNQEELIKAWRGEIEAQEEAMKSWQETMDNMSTEELLQTGYAELNKGRWVDTGFSHELFFRALRRSLDSKDRRGEAEARLALGKLRLRVPDSLGALTYFGLARDLFRALGDRPREIEAEEGLAEAHALLGMLAGARAGFERAAALGGDSEQSILAVEARALAVVSRLFKLQGAYDEAIRHHERIHEIAVELEDPERRQQSRLELGDLYLRVGRYEEALEILLDAEAAMPEAAPDAALLDGATIRTFFNQLMVDSSAFIGAPWIFWFRFTQVLQRWAEALEEAKKDEKPPEDFFEILMAWQRILYSSPTLVFDPAFADRRLAIARQLPFGTDPSQPPPGITPTIRDRVVTSFRIFEPLIGDCRTLHERYPEQVTAVTRRLQSEIPGLSEFRRCTKRIAEDRNVESCETSKTLIEGGKLGFWDLEPPWPVDCGEQEGSFDPQNVAELPSGKMDPDEETWEEYEERIYEKYPELATLSIDEVIANKEQESREIKLSTRGGFFKNLKKSLVQQFVGPFEVFELQKYKMALEIREQGLWSVLAESKTYWHLQFDGFFIAEYFRRVDDLHSETIESMCRQAFETQLRDRLSQAWSKLGASYADEAQAAAEAAWAAQEPLWEGLSYFGIQPESFAALKELGTPAMVFEGCQAEKNKWLSVNQRRVALWRARLSLEEGDYPLAAALFYGAWKGGTYLTRTSEPELEIEALIGLGEAFARQELPAIAATYYQAAIGLVESIQGALREESMTMSFADAQAQLYGRMVDLLFEMDEKVFTFEYFGRAQARAFLKSVGNQRLDLRGVPDDVNQRWQALRAEIAENQRLRQELSGSFSFSGGTERRDLKKRGDELEIRQEALMNELRRRHPSAASFVSVEPVPIESLSGFMVEPDTTVVAYFLTPTRGLAWVIERGASELVELVLDPEELVNQVTEARSRIAQRETPTELLESLYSKLVTPLADKIHHQRLIVVPYGALHQLPFAALRDPASGDYLVEKHSVTLLPSATVMTYVQDRRNPWQERILAVGNPDGSLPAASGEASEIASLYQAEPLLGAAARESTIRAAAGDLDVLHVAAHGRFSEERPMSGYLALAAGDDDDPQDDGRLEVIEILNEIDFEGTNLVVLSACNSSTGKQNRGDDIVSMPRALLYAGSPAVVSTLWSIDDRASAELMAGFHHHLQKEQQGAAKALQQAQIDLLSVGTTASPYYWAGFTLTGDQVSRGAPPERKPGENPWTWNPFAEQDAQPEPPPFVATQPEVLPWSKKTSRAPATELLAEGEALLEERWAFGDGLAFPRLHQALAAAERDGDLLTEARARLGLARLRGRIGDAAGALAHVDLAAAIYDELGDRAGLAAAERAYAQAWKAWGALSESRWAFEDALALDAELENDDPASSALTHEALAEVLELDGAYGAARVHLETADTLWQQAGRPEQALLTEVKAGELMSSLSRDERAVGLLESARDHFSTQPTPFLDPPAAAEVLGQLADLTDHLGRRVESWLAHAWFEDPFADWPDPPTVRDSVFTERRREYLTDLPDFLGGREGQLAITPIHHQFAMSAGVFMRLIRDCAFLHIDYGNDVKSLRAAGSSELLRADWPSECGPRRERFDPRFVEHTLDGSLPDREEAKTVLATWRRERAQRAKSTEDSSTAPDWSRAKARTRKALEAMQKTPDPEPQDDPSLLFSDKKIVYYLLSSSLPAQVVDQRARYVEELDRMCQRDVEVRTHNALWRSYSRLGEERAEEAETSRHAGWQAAAPLWQAWFELGWTPSEWQALRDAGLPAPVLGSCRSETRGIIDRHEIDVWRGHVARRQGESALAKAWYRRASGAEGGWPAPRPTTVVSAYVGLAELHAENKRIGLAALYYRKAIGHAESVSEGFRPEELAAPYVDVAGLYERLNGLLDELGEDDLEFKADLRDSLCPDRTDREEQMPEDVPPNLETERDELCLDLVALHNREVALRAHPMAIAGYQGSGNSLERLRQQRIWLEKGLRRLDYEIRFPASQQVEASETSTPPSEGEQMVSLAEIDVGEQAALEEVEEEEKKGGKKFLPKFLTKRKEKKEQEEKKSGRGGLLSWEGIQDRLTTAVVDKALDAVKRQGRLLRSRRRHRKARRRGPTTEEILGVTIFHRAEYQGLSEKFFDDDPTLKDNVILHDLARSIKIDPGCRAILYEHNDYGGSSTILRNDTPFLIDTLVGKDSVSSLRVDCR